MIGPDPIGEALKASIAAQIKMSEQLNALQQRIAGLEESQNALIQEVAARQPVADDELTAMAERLTRTVNRGAGREEPG